MKTTHTNFETFVARHGEVVTQAILENLERYEGIRADAGASLAQRWAALMQKQGDDHIHAVLALAA